MPEEAEVKRVSPRRFADILRARPPEEGGRDIGERGVRGYATKGRIEGAEHVEVAPVRFEWRIPVDARLLEPKDPSRRRHRGPGLSVMEYAKLHGVTRKAVYYHLERENIPGVKRDENGSFSIPAEAPYPSRK